MAWAPVQRRRRALGAVVARRGRVTLVTPPQFNPPFPFAETVQRRQEWPRGLPRRGRVTLAVPPQLGPPYPLRRARLAFAATRRHPVPLLLAPQDVPDQRHSRRLPLPVRPRRRVEYPPPQDAAAWPPPPRRRVAAPGRRRGAAQPVPAQVAVTAASFVPQPRHRQVLACTARRVRWLFPWAVTVPGALTASSAPGAALTATAAAQGSLTAGTQKTGGPG